MKSTRWPAIVTPFSSCFINASGVGLTPRISCGRRCANAHAASASILTRAAPRGARQLHPLVGRRRPSLPATRPSSPPPNRVGCDSFGRKARAVAPVEKEPTDDRVVGVPDAEPTAPAAVIPVVATLPRKLQSRSSITLCGCAVQPSLDAEEGHFTRPVSVEPDKGRSQRVHVLLRPQLHRADAPLTHERCRKYIPLGRRQDLWVRMRDRSSLPHAFVQHPDQRRGPRRLAVADLV